MSQPQPPELDPATERDLAAALFNETWKILEQETRSQAMARATLIGGDRDGALAWRDRAREALIHVADADDRDQIKADLEALLLD